MFHNTETTNTDQASQIDFVAANQNIVDNIELILNSFDIDYKILHNRITLPCPVHGSSREASLNIFTTGRDCVGNFQCWTNHCEREIGYGVLNLIKYLLEQKQGQMSYSQVIHHLERLTGSEFATINLETVERRRFSRFIGNEPPAKSTKILINRDKVRESLQIPSDYYIGRGFSKEVLDKYDVGNCFTRGKPMFMRCVVPCYDQDARLVGAVGRSLNDECPICGSYHFNNRPCPSNDLEKKWAAKWINSDGFKTGDFFYNMQYAIPSIARTESVILVEGQGDVWRLSEAGINNSLGLFGCDLTDNKFAILAKLPIMNVYLALDSDGAGTEATKKIMGQLSRYYNVRQIILPQKDVGDLPVDVVKSLFGQFV